MSFLRYANYQPSGVAWLGEVPGHWEVTRIKNIIRSFEQGWSPQCEGFPVERDDEWGVLKVGCVNGGVFRPAENKALPSGLDAPAELGIRQGDLLISRANTRELVGSAAVARRDFLNLLLCDKLYRARVDADRAVPEFVGYFLGTGAARGFVEVAATGASSSMLNIGQGTILEMPLPIPGISEQREIVGFLDRETSKIDALIAEQERLIALLAEKRQATISQAVTRGLNPDAPMKDSGVAWLWEVPAHWTSKRLKNISPFVTVGIVVNPSDYVSDDGLPFVYGGDIEEGRISIEGSRRISAEDSARQAKTRLEKGDLLTVRVGAPGITAVVPESCAGGNCASVMLTRRGEFDSEWLCHAMNSRMVRFQVEVVQYGAAQEQFNISHAINFWVMVPPRTEQAEIAAFLTHEVARLEELGRAAKQVIALLHERRSALIAAAVTGQIDVRSVVAGEAAV